MKIAKSGQTGQWHFEPDSEDRLTEWMKDNLEYTGLTCAAQPAGLRASEAALIQQLDPPLNLDHIQRQTRRFLQDRRAICRKIVRTLRDQADEGAVT